MVEGNIVLFGAGKIGRSFIGQLFSRAGYEVIFIDLDRELVRELNSRKSYPVIIKGPEGDKKIVVEKVSAIHSENKDEVMKAISRADIMAISVGKAALPLLAPGLAKGLLLREEESPGRTLDMILAENMRSAGSFFRKELRKHLPSAYPLDQRAGLVETSIGKMVPIMTEEDLKEDPLQVFAEAYNTLILDKGGFVGEIPEIQGFDLKDNMDAWVDRKAFIHNLGHATLAYAGHLKMPRARYLREVMEDQEVVGFTRTVMLEAAGILLKKYPDAYSMPDLENHIEDLLQRFGNRNLGDTIFRVGADLPRKLGKDDRFMGIFRMSEELDLACPSILKAMAMGFLFRGQDEKGRMYLTDQKFIREFSNSSRNCLSQYCGLEEKDEEQLIRPLLDHIRMLDVDNPSLLQVL